MGNSACSFALDEGQQMGYMEDHIGGRVSLPVESPDLRSTPMTSIEIPLQRSGCRVVAIGIPRTTQMKFRLSDPLHDRIEKAAKENGWGASEEIRRRLEASFVLEADDDETSRLMEAIKTVARHLQPPFGPWHKSRFAFEVFREAINALLALSKPPGDPVRPSDNEIADLYLGERGMPETAGRMLAGGAAVAANIPIPNGAKRRDPSQGEGRR